METRSLYLKRTRSLGYASVKLTAKANWGQCGMSTQKKREKVVWEMSSAVGVKLQYWS